jgi:hypothetical protein
LQPKVIQALHTNLTYITALEVDLDKSVFFVGNKYGKVYYFEYSDYLTRSDNVNITKKLELNVDGIKITAIKYNHKNEIILALGNGSIAVYTHDSEHPECNIT